MSRPAAGPPRAWGGRRALALRTLAGRAVGLAPHGGGRGGTRPPLVFGGAACLLFAAPAALLAQESGGWNQLFSVKPGLSIWTLATFAAVMFVLGRYAWGPLTRALEARQTGIQGDIDEARRQREEAETLLAQYREQLVEGRRQVQAMMAEGREAAERLRKELEAKARDESQAILENTRKEIRHERAAAVEAVRREAVDVALAAASRLVSERLDAERDRRLVADYIGRMAEAEEGLQA